MNRFALLVMTILVGGCAHSEKAALPDPPPLRPEPSPPGEVDKLLDQMDLANVAFNVPQSMNLYDTATVELALSLDTPIEELQREIDASDDPEIATIKVSNRMEARLSGAHFSITAITPEQQAIAKTEVTKWQWEIKPVGDGPWILHLTISALLNVEGSSTPKAIITFDREIEVDVTLSQRATTFLENNWQWLFATVLIPLGIWWLKYRKGAKPRA